MIKHIQEVYKRIRYHYEIAQPPAPVDPNLGIHTGNSNHSILGGLFDVTHISATGLTSEPLPNVPFNSVTTAWYNVGGYLRHAMEAKRIELEEQDES